MPFPIWCTHCPKPTIIGQGVRFNAEKKKVGNYHSTPVFGFRMKHVACGGTIEIRTDPKNTAYVVTEGAKKRDLGEGKVLDGEIMLRTPEERERLENDVFARLEDRNEDKVKLASEKSRIGELYRAKDRDWDDPGEANRRLRMGFRVERKVRESKAGNTEALKERMSLGIDLLEETEEDRRRAGFVEFGELSSEQAVVKAQSKPLFKGVKVEKKPLAKRIKWTSSTAAAEQRRENLRKELGDNTRTALDPFLGNHKAVASHAPLIKRKDTSMQVLKERAPVQHEENASVALVDYDSD